MNLIEIFPGFARQCQLDIWRGTPRYIRKYMYIYMDFVQYSEAAGVWPRSRMLQLFGTSIGQVVERCKPRYGVTFVSLYAKIPDPIKGS